MAENDRELVDELESARFKGKKLIKSKTAGSSHDLLRIGK